MTVFLYLNSPSSFTGLTDFLITTLLLVFSTSRKWKLDSEPDFFRFPTPLKNRNMFTRKRLLDSERYRTPVQPGPKKRTTVTKFFSFTPSLLPIEIVPVRRFSSEFRIVVPDMWVVWKGNVLSFDRKISVLTSDYLDSVESTRFLSSCGDFLWRKHSIL